MVIGISMVLLPFAMNANDPDYGFLALGMVLAVIGFGLMVQVYFAPLNASMWNSLAYTLDPNYKKGPQQEKEALASDILDMRLARGEITIEEFVELKSLIKK